MNRINLICLGTRDMAKALAFYKGMGFKTYAKGDSPAIVFFDNQGSKLELYPLEALAKDINADNPPAVNNGGFSGITLACNVKSEREVDELINNAPLHGGKIAKTPEKTFWGGYSGYFQDPDGYYWEVAHADIWKFDANDMLVIEPEE